MLTAMAEEELATKAHLGRLASATHVGEEGLRGNGPYFYVYLLVEGDRIQTARFESNGCQASFAVGGVLCRLVEGRNVTAALSLEPRDLATLVGELAPGKADVPTRALRALALAMKGPEDSSSNFINPS